MSKDATKVLNELIETSKDGEKGFTKAAQDAKDPQLRTVFSEGAQRCREGAQELEAKVRMLGGKPETSGSALGAMHRGWIEARTAVTSRDDRAILIEAERGEDFAKARYQEALDEELPEDVRSIVAKQYEGVIANHDRVRALRDQYAKRS